MNADDDIISEEVNQKSQTMEVPVDDFSFIPSETDTFGSDISVASYSTDNESDKKIDRKMQPDYDGNSSVDDFDILGTSKPVSSKERELINIDICELCPTVYNQHAERSCLAISSSDMTGVLRKHNVLDDKTILSPQPLIDSRIILDTDVRRLDLFACDSKLGFPSISTYRYLGMERPIEDWSWKKYRRSNHKRHPICVLREVFQSEYPKINHNTDGPIIDELESNFRSDGKQYPLVCSLDFSYLRDGEVAKKYAKGSKGGYPVSSQKSQKETIKQWG